MSNIQSILDKGIENIMGAGGLSTNVKIIEYTFDSGSYDDDVTQTAIGSETVSGLVFPVRSRQGSEEALLLENGKLLTKDKILYTGSVNVSGNVLLDISGDKFTIIEDGVSAWQVNGSTVYNKMFIRQSIGGSLF